MSKFKKLMDEVKNEVLLSNNLDNRKTFGNQNDNEVLTMIELCNKKIEQEPNHLKALLLRSGSYLKIKNYLKVIKINQRLLKM